MREEGNQNRKPFKKGAENFSSDQDKQEEGGELDENGQISTTGAGHVNAFYRN